jgi:hypothetical protein
MTTKLIFSTITEAELTRFVNLQEGEIDDYEWTQVDSFPVAEIDQQYLQAIKLRLLKMPTHLVNEATVWSMAIYPLLLLVAYKSIQTWAQVPLQAQYAKFELEGIADGVLGKVVAGRLKFPYLVMVETKKGVEGKNPVFQLYAQLLAAARLNWEHDHQSPQEIFGCYTIADSWTLVRAEVEGIDTDLPTLRIEYSREYTEKTEAETIFKILKNIVAKHVK